MILTLLPNLCTARPFRLEPTEKPIEVAEKEMAEQLSLGLDLQWAKPKRPKQQPIEGDLFGGERCVNAMR